MYRVMSAPADLAEFRLLRALRGGQPGALPSLWNAQAGAMWSVVRAMCNTDRDAIGWMTSFRLDFTERAQMLDATRPVAGQIGVALHRHLRAQFHGDAALPEGRLPSTEIGVRAVPEAPRLLYLVDLFFDLSDDGLREAAGRDAPHTVDAVRALLEPASDDTDNRLLVHTALLRTPPIDVLILPPGEEPPTPRPRWGLLVAASVAVLAGVLAVVWAGVLVRDHYTGATWEELGGIHAAVVGGATPLQTDAAALGAELAAAHAPAVLREVPDLSAAGLQLLGGIVEPRIPAVVLSYHDGARLWTLQHLTRLPAPADAAAHEAGDAVGVSWPEGPTGWVLLGDAPPDRVLALAARIREARHTSEVPFLGAPSGGARPSTLP